MTSNIAFANQLDECLDWIVHNNYRRLVLQFNSGELRDSVEIVSYLREAHRNKQQLTDGQTLDLYVSQSNTCCVDLIVTQHVSNVDAIIHFGPVCLSRPHIQNQEHEKPILFVFGRIVANTFAIDVQEIITQIEQNVAGEDSNRPVCILYDSNLCDYAKEICDGLSRTELGSSIEVAKLLIPTDNWHTTPSHQSVSTRRAQHILGHHSLTRPVKNYNSMVYLGTRLSIKTKLEGPRSCWRIDCYDYLDLSEVNVSRALNKRMALVDRLRDDEELKIGVIITNPLPNISESMRLLENYAKARRHTLYFISMIQTIDECKIGNFDLCDAFVVINACTCSTILENLCFNRPIINDLEFKLACGFEGTYGRIYWPASESHLTADDMINKRKVSDVSLALVHSRNEILEKCSTARTNKWSGMEYKAAGDPDGGAGSSRANESTTIEEGLSGIASSYASEPLNKPVVANDVGESQLQDHGSDRA